MDLRSLLLEIVFISFGIFIPLTAFLELLRFPEFKEQMKSWTQSAIAIVRIAGMLYLLHWAAVELITFNGYENSSLTRLEGEYWGPYVMGWFLLPALMQLYWLKFWSQRKLPRITLAFVILFISSLMSGLYFDIVMKLGSEYGSNISNGQLLFDILKNIILFLILVFVVNRLGLKKSKSLQSQIK